MSKTLKDIVYQFIEAYYEFEKANRIKNNAPLGHPFDGIDVTNIQSKIFQRLNINAKYSDIENYANELVEEGKAKYVPLNRAYTSTKAPNKTLHISVNDLEAAIIKAFSGSNEPIGPNTFFHNVENHLNIKIDEFFYHENMYPILKQLEKQGVLTIGWKLEYPVHLKLN